MKFLSIITLAALMLGCATKQSTFLQQEDVQLSAPYVQAEDVFFRKETKIKFGKYPDNVSLFVTGISGNNSQSQIILSNELSITESVKLSFQSNGDEYAPSEISEVQLYKVKDRTVDLTYLSQRAAPYNLADESVLIDQQKAAKQFSDSGWLGFKEDSVVIELVMNGEALEGVALSVLQDQKSWIFGPSSMRVDAFDSDGSLRTSSAVDFNAAQQHDGASFQFLESSSEVIFPAKLRITIYPLTSIPSWHPGSGNIPWLFIDEIVLL